MKKNKIKFYFVLTLFLSALLPSAMKAQETSPAENFMGNAIADDVDVSADDLAFVGSNVIAKGNVQIVFRDLLIKCDKAIVNISAKDVEAIGNVVFIQRSEDNETLTMREYNEYRKDPDRRIRIDNVITEATGKQMLECTTLYDINVFKAQKVVGNLGSGVIEFKDFSCQAEKYFCHGKYATRDPDGTIVIKNAKLSTCEYLLDDQEHYSITAGTVKIFPGGGAMPSKNLTSYNPSQSEHSIWAYNCTARVGDVPVFWFPMLYKPTGNDLHWFQVKAGETSEWGYFLQLSKTFKICDYPDTDTQFFLDYYTDRGLGYGNETVMRTENSYTEFFYYGIWDDRPYGRQNETEADAFQKVTRMKVPHYRYDLRLSNLTHITPRLDFRGHFEKLSDIYFLKDFFRERYDIEPQPTSFASLEYQFNHFSLSALVRPKVNTFYTVVERIPELKIDIPRQELFHNIYYQGETSLDYLNRSWRHYEKPRTTGNGIDPQDYKTFRFDTLHFFYYPMEFFGFLNIIPRAGFRLTYYSNTSKNLISSKDLANMFAVDNPDQQVNGTVFNYDSDGGGKLRFAGEIGIQANTKIYASWQNVKNAFWGLDGLRHVMVPYINYTYIPEPTVHRNRLYYFDDIDRIERQNFIRFGLKNRLQTRRGNYGSENLYNWVSLENYIDYHFISEKGFAKLGDLGTILEFNPFEGLTLRSELLLDLGQTNDHNVETARGAKPVRYVERKGISNKWINKWETSITYEIIENLKVYAKYNYQDAYAERSAYSMGSTLTNINSGSDYVKYYSGRYQVATLGAEFPIPIDDKTFGAIEIEYDIEAGYMRQKRLRLVRNFHCWEASIELSQEIERNVSDGDKEHNNSVMFALYLTDIPGVRISHREDMGGSGGGGSSY